MGACISSAVKGKVGMAKKILVSGATGNVGQEVIRALLAAGVEVRGADVDPQQIQQIFGGEVKAERFLFGDARTYPAVFRDVEAMFLMRPPQITDIRRYILPALDAAIHAGVKRVSFLSLIGIENNTQVPHYQVEQYLKMKGVEYTFLRCSFFMQNLNTTHLAEIRDRDEIFIPAGKSRTAFIDVRDIGAVAALTLTQPGHARRAYDLTGAEALDYWQVARLFSQSLDRPIRYRNPNGPQYVLRQLREGKGLLYALITAWLYASTRSGMAEQVTGEVARLLGREPISLRQYVQDYIPVWQKPAAND